MGIVAGRVDRRSEGYGVSGKGEASRRYSRRFLCWQFRIGSPTKKFKLMLQDDFFRAAQRAFINADNFLRAAALIPGRGAIFF